MSDKIWRVAGINFDHFHMGDLLRMVNEHPRAEIVAVSDHEQRTVEATSNFDLSADQVFSDYRKCLEQSKPDFVILCPAAARHAEWTEKVAEFRLPILMEKPFAATVEEADRMIAVMKQAGQPLAINWPLRWCESHSTAHRLVTEGRIGTVQEVHYYDGNRGPLWHGADKLVKEPTAAEKDASWFYKQAEGGGSLQDYLGYGTTLGTWYHGGKVPSEVICMCGSEAGLEVDEHSITVARYDVGLSKFETRWGTFSDPWVQQPQPKCGFVIKGTAGNIASYDYDSTIRVQTTACLEGEDVAVDPLPFANAIDYFIDCLANDRTIEGPLSVEVSRIGQLIVDAAVESAATGAAVQLRS